MSKRASCEEIAEHSGNKIERRSMDADGDGDDSQPNKQSQPSKQPQLPMEMIILIISKLSSIEDLRTCMLLSKEIRDLMFKTPEIMKRIKMTLEKELQPLLKEKGRFIKNAEIYNADSLNYLQLTQNLEDLSLSLHDAPKNVENIEDLDLKFVELMSLDISVYNEHQYWPKLISSLSMTKKLKSLKIHRFSSTALDEDLTDFICQQDSLRELKIYFKNLFPSRDVTSIVKFKLTELRVSIDDHHIDTEYFLKFLKTQAASVKILSICGELQHQTRIFELIFSHFQKVEDLELGFRYLEILNENLQMPSVKRFRVIETSIQDAYAKFPNLEVLNCSSLKESSGKFTKLTELKVYKFDVGNIRDLKLPNLKILEISKFLMHEQSPNLMNFVENSPNIENVEFGSIFNDDESVFIEILKVTKFWKNLMKFHVSCDVEDNDDNDWDMYFRHLIVYFDRNDKFITVSPFLGYYYHDICDVLRESFPGIDIMNYDDLELMRDDLDWSNDDD